METRGKLIFSPCGSGKTYFIEHTNTNILDGDVILEKAGVKNRNYFWYGDYPLEQARIQEVIESHLRQGFHVLYSGNPRLWKPDFIVTIPDEVRWKRVSTRAGYRPSKEAFDRETLAYQIDDIPRITFFHLLTPDF